MKADEIREAAAVWWALECKWPTDASKDDRACFEAGARWMQSNMRERIKIAMGALWDEDEITGSLWLGSTAICQIKAALTIEEPANVEDIEI